MFPIVIVGKDRTLMTMAAIEHLDKHLRKYNPYYIHVSDRSSPGHVDAIEETFERLGIENCCVLRTDPKRRYGWGAAMNIGLEKAFEFCNNALVIDNDWLLERDIPLFKYDDLLDYSPVGYVNLKWINGSHRIIVKEEDFNGGKYLVRDKADCGINLTSFVVDVGSMVVSKRLMEEVGWMLENVNKTDPVEEQFIRKYLGIGDVEERRRKRVLAVSDTALLYQNLNGAGHVFTHVGVTSQSGRVQTWWCPDEYVHLSDRDAEEKARKDALERHSRGAMDNRDTNTIDWTNYFDQIYVTTFLPKPEKFPRLKRELQRVGIWDSGILNVRYTSPCSYDKVIWDVQKDRALAPAQSFVNIAQEVRKCLAEAKAFGYKRILMLEDDVTFLKDLNLVKEILDDSPKGYGIVQYDKFVNDSIVEIYRQKIANERISKHFFNGKSRLAFTSAACFALFDHGPGEDGIGEFLKNLDIRVIATDLLYLFAQCCYAVSIDNMAIQTFISNSYSVGDCGISYMHKVYDNAGIDLGNYATPDGYEHGKEWVPPESDRDIGYKNRNDK